MPNVLITNKGFHDYSDAKRFGKLIFMSEGSLPPFDINNMARTFKPYIEKSNPEDFILLTGLTSMCSVISSMFAFKHGQVNWLIFKNGKYIERTIKLNNRITKEVSDETY